MTLRETIWRGTFGALGAFCFVMALLSASDLPVAFVLAGTCAIAWFMALDDAMEGI